eukprot:COSAG06_NODE_13633_length_1236_cov_18.207564_2_plen_139_part_00
MQSFALLAMALVVAVHHRELAAHRDDGGADATPHRHRMLRGTEAPDAPPASRETLVGEQLWWQEIDQRLDQKVAETVRDQVAALEKREDASIDELRDLGADLGEEHWAGLQGRGGTLCARAARPAESCTGDERQGGDA